MEVERARGRGRSRHRAPRRRGRLRVCVSTRTHRQTNRINLRDENEEMSRTNLDLLDRLHHQSRLHHQARMATTKHDHDHGLLSESALRHDKSPLRVTSKLSFFVLGLLMGLNLGF